MGAVFFYHLTRSPLEVALPGLLEKALAQGWRVTVRGRTEAVMDHLDRVLWLGEGFLPHGRSGGAHDARQPVLLSTGTELRNGPNCLMSVEGAGIAPEEASAVSRACILFDGGDAAAVETARAQWRTLTSAGLAAEYWNQSDGRWSRQAASQ